MSEETHAQRLWRQLTEAKSATDFRGIASEVARLEPDVRAEDHLEYLRGQALIGLLDLSRDHLDEALNIILMELLPLCLREKWPHHPEGGRYDEILRDWLGQLPGVDRTRLREPVLASCTTELDGPRARQAVSLVATLGYRADTIVAALADLISKHDDLGDVALHARVMLGVNDEDRPHLLKELHSRIAAGRWNLQLVGVAQKLARSESVDFVFNYWLTPVNLVSEQVQQQLLADITLQIPPAVADREWANVGLQDRVWRRLLSLRDQNQTLLDRLLSLNGQFGQLCDSPEVIETYLGLINNKYPVGKARAYQRLAECVRPRQLEGWACALPEEVRIKLLEDALSPSGMEGQWSTVNLDCKQGAWQTLFCLGSLEALGRLDEALDAEANGFAIAEVLKVASCFSIIPLPRRVPELIAARFGSIPETGNERIAAQIAAIQLARSAATEEALTALLDYTRFHVPGVLLSLVDALVDTVEVLVRSGDRSAVETLLAIALPHPGDKPDQRSAAAAALARLVRQQVLREIPVSELLALANDPVIHPVPRRQVLDAIGYLSRMALEPSTLEQFRGLARGIDWLAPDEGSVAGEQWGAVALRVLARHGRLVDDDQLLHECLGLELDQTGWRLQRESRHSARDSYVLGLLYADRPTLFAPAVVGILQTGDWPAVARLVAPLRETRPVPQVIVDALVERFSRARDGRTAEPDLLGLLAAVAPERLASEDWPGLRDWLPLARLALADALGAAGQLRGEPQRRRLQLLAELMAGGLYGVRRAAYRAMAAVAPSEFGALCLTWGELTDPSAVELRQRAAEGVAWCSNEKVFQGLSGLATDPEPSVREAFERCSRERREREWASHYLDRVLGVQNGQHVLDIWRYARALEQLGDDWVVQKLEEHQRKDGLPPAVRIWLGRLSDRIRKRWEEVTRKWPGPWFARKGALEHVRGTLRLRDGTAADFDGWLWHEAGAEPTASSAWGGWAEHASLPPAMQTMGEMTLALEGRKPARILVKEIHLPQGHLSFSGQEPFPATI